MKEKYEFEKYLEKVRIMKGRSSEDFKGKTLGDYFNRFLKYVRVMSSDGEMRMVREMK